jgi:hypothetical protein
VAALGGAGEDLEGVEAAFLEAEVSADLGAEAAGAEGLRVAGENGS